MTTSEDVTQAEDIERLQAAVQALKLWEVEHDARINAKWERQEEENDEVVDKMAVIHDRISATNKRVSSIEKKIIWFCGIAAGVGAVIGTSLPQLLQKLGG